MPALSLAARNIDRHHLNSQIELLNGDLWDAIPEPNDDNLFDLIICNPPYVNANSMNALPAAVFLIFRKRFQLSPEQRSFWTWMACSALLFIPLLVVSPSSTAVDRVALYWIPLQLFVLSRLPNALGQRDGKNADWVYGVVAYSAVVHFVWLVFADTAFAWLPYQFYPMVWLYR